MSTSPHRVLDLSVSPRNLPREEFIRSAQDGEPSALLMSLVQVTGDAGHLDHFGPKISVPPVADNRLLPTGQIADADRAELIALLADALDSDSQAEYMQVPDRDLFQRMLNAAIGAPVPAEALGVVMEQAGFQLSQPIIARTTSPTPEFSVAVLGAGMSGIFASVALADAGFTHEIFEASDDIGGTWRINSYPGAAVDTPSMYYSYSFELEPNWTKYFPSGTEYQEYLRHVVDKYDVKQRIRFNTEITSLAWDDAAQEWIIGVSSNGVAGTHRANAVITAAGFLNRPTIPDVAGSETFTGTQLHTARWDHSLDLTGKRVGVVGAGATSIQVVDAITNSVEHLTLFQRQAHWVRPNTLGDGAIPDSERWLQRAVPFYDRWQRARTYWLSSDRNYPAYRADPAWMAENPLSISAANDVVMQSCLGHLRSSFGHDPELLAKMTPDFPVHGKRIIRDPGGYYAALASEKASVVSDAIAEITPQGIVTADGTLIELDVIIWATGFSLDFLGTLDITGIDGIRLADQWGGRNPKSYLGGTVPNFPNLFVTSGPNSSNGHGGGHNFMTEAVVHYIMECLQLLTERGASSLVPTIEAQDALIAEIDQQMEGSIWRNSNRAHTYYRNDNGRVILPNPWTMVDYWEMLRTPDPAKFVIR